MPRGANPEREKEYKELVDKFEDEGRYKGREEEVASRIVNKQRAEMGETQEAQEKDKEGRSPDRSLPIADYDNLTVDEITARLDDLSGKEIDAILRYEKQHRQRKTLIDALSSKHQA